MSTQLSSIVPSLAILGTLALSALYLTFTRGWADKAKDFIPGALPTAAVAVLAQAAHFTEELLTGFHQRFPALFGRGPMPLEFFASFNIAWLLIWGLSVWGLAKHRRAALFPLWFLGIGCVANMIAHPMLSLLVDGYFPGLVTSPLVGVLGVLLLRRLLLVTQVVAATVDA